LEAIVRDRNVPQKHVWRAEIVLLKAEGLGTVEIMRRTGKSKTCVWRWQERFMRSGPQESGEGLLRLRHAPRIVPQPARTPKKRLDHEQKPLTGRHFHAHAGVSVGRIPTVPFIRLRSLPKNAGQLTVTSP
jgi:Homeodomain-like domain